MTSQLCLKPISFSLAFQCNKGVLKIYERKVLLLIFGQCYILMPKMLHFSIRLSIYIHISFPTMLLYFFSVFVLHRYKIRFFLQGNHQCLMQQEDLISCFFTEADTDWLWEGITGPRPHKWLSCLEGDGNLIILPPSPAL